MIKITTMKHYGKTYYFKKYIAENGNFICTVDGEVVSKDEGNKLFLELKSKYPKCVIEKEIIDLNDKEIIESLDKRIDKYVEYIDDYTRYRQIKDINEELYKIIYEFESIC